jgi:hypothetical protein
MQISTYNRGQRKTCGDANTFAEVIAVDETSVLISIVHFFGVCLKPKAESLKLV